MSTPVVPPTPPVRVAAIPQVILQEAESDALTDTRAGFAIWGLIYVAVIAVCAVLGYLLVEWVSQGNQNARTALVPIALFISGLFVPSPLKAIPKGN